MDSPSPMAMGTPALTEMVPKELTAPEAKVSVMLTCA